MSMSSQRFLAILAVPFALLFAWLAIEPFDRSDWALENVLVGVCVVALAVSARAFPLSKPSYGLVFVFLCIHEVGAHFTYAEVPYDAFLVEHFGFSLDQAMGWQRNQFDRFVHFIYGLLLAYPVRELYSRLAGVRGFWAYFLPVEMVMASSMLFELFEWGAAEVFGGDLGVAYLGTQGDVWDAHKDMLLATLGGLIAMLIVLAVNLSRRSRR